MEANWIPLPELNVEICETPVLTEEYLLYAAAKQLPQPAQKNHQSAARLPIVGISASEAIQYAEWLGQKNGHIYRLPVLSEMQALARLVGRESSVGLCRPDPWYTIRLTCQYEWLGCASNSTPGISTLHCVTHPQWLKTPERKIIKAALVDDALAYVTFRLVRLY